MAAIMRTAKRSADILEILKLHIGVGVDTGYAEDNCLDIQIWIAEMDAEFKGMYRL